MVDCWVERMDAMKMGSRAGQTATMRADSMALATCSVCSRDCRCSCELDLRIGLVGSKDGCLDG